MPKPKVVLFTCNWNAYNGLEAAGAAHRVYSASIHPIRVACLGQISPGVILKAFENGADGVLLLGCPPGECHYEFGNRRAEEVFVEAKRLARLLGYGDEQLSIDSLTLGEGEAFVEKVACFVAGLNGSKEK